MIDSLVDALKAFSVVLEWPNPLWIIGAVLFGMFIGFLPGMSGAVALALVIPLSFVLDTEVAVLFLIAAYSPTGFGGMLTSILVNTPGAPENAATTFDGYPLAKQGRAGAAIGAATAASVIGGLLGTIFLILMVPWAQELILSFSYPEFLMMAVLGLLIIAVVTVGNAFKGLIAAGFGFLISFIGLDPVVGNPRFTFDQLYLWNGVDIVPLLLGLFAGAEILALFGSGSTVSRSASTNLAKKRGSRRRGSVAEPVTFWEGVWTTFRHKFLLVRASLIGVVTGVIPAVGGSVASFLAYAHAKQTSKHPEKFGKGAIDGVIAAESANDAKEGGSLLPTVAFGIPGSVGMAVLLGALIMHGIPAGPALMIDNADLIYVLIAGMVAAKVVAPIVVWAVSGQAIKLTRVRPGLFTPLIAIAALVGAYTVRLDILDVFVALLFAYVGHAMVKYGYSRIALLIAVVLGDMVERTYHQTIATFGGLQEIALRPISGVLLALTVVFVIYTIVKAVRRRGRKTESLEGTGEITGTIEPGRFAFSLLILGFATLLVVDSYSLSEDAQAMPLIFGFFVIATTCVQLAVDGWRLVRLRAERKATSVAGRVRAGVLAGDTAPVAAGGGTAVGDTDSDGLKGTVDQLREQARAAEAEAFDEVEYTPRQQLWRQAMFGVWAVALVVLASLTSFMIAVPICLFAFLLLLAKERLLVALITTAATTAGLYLMFEIALGVSLT